MPREPRSAVEMRDFPGLILNADAHDLNPGAAEEQLNCTSDTVGMLKSRRGFRVVEFDPPLTTTTTTTTTSTTTEEPPSTTTGTTTSTTTGTTTTTTTTTSTTTLDVDDACEGCGLPATGKCVWIWHPTHPLAMDGWLFCACSCGFGVNCNCFPPSHQGSAVGECATNDAECL